MSLSLDHIMTMSRTLTSAECEAAILLRPPSWKKSCGRAKGGEGIREGRETKGGGSKGRGGDVTRREERGRTRGGEGDRGEICKSGGKGKDRESWMRKEQPQIVRRRRFGGAVL